MKKILINTPQQSLMQVDRNGNTMRQMFGTVKPVEEKKDWEVTLSYKIPHKDTYSIKNETKEEAVYIAENQNSSPRYDCTLIKEDEGDMEDEETTIKEVKDEKI